MLHRSRTAPPARSRSTARGALRVRETARGDGVEREVMKRVQCYHIVQSITLGSL